MNTSLLAVEADTSARRVLGPIGRATFPGRAGILARGPCGGDVLGVPAPAIPSLAPATLPPRSPGVVVGGRHEQRGLDATRHRAAPNVRCS